MVALVWCGAVLAYMAYAGFTYTGLYEWLAEREQAWFGAYDPSLTFVVLLIGLCLPAFLSAPTRRRRLALPAGADPLASQRLVKRTVWAAAAALLLVGLGAGGLALWRGARTPLVASIDLAQSSEFPPNADQLIVTGRAQRSRTVVVAETMRGSTTRTAYTPLTAPGWTPLQPIRFVMREGLASQTDERSGTPDAGRTVRFGPAVLLRHELPGPVRAGLNRGGMTIAADAVLLDENLESANFTLWIIAFFGCVLAISLALVSSLVARAQARHAARAISTAAPPSVQPPQPGAARSSYRAADLGPAPPPRRWRLMLGPQLMAELTWQSYQTPWITVAVKAQPGLAPFIRYFGDAEEWPDHDPTIDAIVAEVSRRGRFELFDEKGLKADPFTLVNLTETSANLRY